MLDTSPNTDNFRHSLCSSANFISCRTLEMGPSTKYPQIIYLGNHESLYSIILIALINQIQLLY